jgi:polysaccharide pyruvyl transferase WcaK-like protein
VRILVDQSGYDLLNLGDVAMLQSCVARLRAQWPGAEIMVITHDPQSLVSYCPGVTPVGIVADSRLFRLLPRKARLVCEQAWKLAAPYTAGRSGHRVVLGKPRTAVQAVHAADVVVASGGAYLTDTWWWHAAGVLSLLSLAQRLGKPTAMFGQGIGPMRLRALRAQSRAVLPGLVVLGLREDRLGRDLALTFGAMPGVVMVTGDDALESIGDTKVSEGDGLGLSLRVADYAGVDHATAAAIGDLMLETAATLGAPVVALPVCRHAADAAVLRALLGGAHSRPGIEVTDLESPRELFSAAASCRTIVTGSYHAAVFGLAYGVPAVCLTKSSYYDAKFGGLQALFPDACFVVSLDAPDLPDCLRRAIQQAWQLPAPSRAAARDTAARLKDAGREAYAQFRIAVDKDSVMAAADSQEGVVR